MHTENATNLHVGPQGRLVIPASIRKLLGLEPGSELVMWVRDGQLILETKKNVERRLLSRYAHLPKDRLVSEELIAERRAEAAREQSLVDG